MMLILIFHQIKEMYGPYFLSIWLWTLGDPFYQEPMGHSIMNYIWYLFIYFLFLFIRTNIVYILYYYLFFFHRMT
jgi:hypothetical protein